MPLEQIKARILRKNWFLLALLIGDITLSRSESLDKYYYLLVKKQIIRHLKEPVN